MSMDISPDVVVDGQYYWQMVFHYQNPKNVKITQVYKSTYSKEVNARVMLQNTFNVSGGFSYENKTNASLKYKGVAEGGGTQKYGLHTETAYELQTVSETDKDIKITSEADRSYDIGPSATLELYQLFYTTQGVVVGSEIFSTQPLDNVIVKLIFSCHSQILGLDQILECFKETRPSRSNVPEWVSIRDSIISNITLSANEQFKRFVGRLSTTIPKVDNQAEWEAIRTTCGEILRDWDDSDKQLLFKKLLERFSVTAPSRDNQLEWDRIRGLSNNLLGTIRQIYGGETN